MTSESRPASLDRAALLRRFWEVTPVTRLAPPPKAPVNRPWKPEPPKRSIRVWPELPHAKSSGLITRLRAKRAEERMRARHMETRSDGDA